MAVIAKSSYRSLVPVRGLCQTLQRDDMILQRLAWRTVVHMTCHMCARPPALGSFSKPWPARIPAAATSPPACPGDATVGADTQTQGHEGCHQRGR
jgi:hypothetical protein